jgi:S-DNA-T family DNA segregation ATPase FtsK/SpoIIIE
MLYLPPGTGLPMRVHGAFVADHEVHKVVSKLKENYTPQYNDEILNGTPEGDAVLPGEKPPEGEADELYDEAVAFVTQARRVSISSVQRRFKVGYNRAARLVEDMERAGVVGPIESNGAREVLAPPPPDVD